MILGENRWPRLRSLGDEKVPVPRVLILSSQWLVERVSMYGRAALYSPVYHDGAKCECFFVLHLYVSLNIDQTLNVSDTPIRVLEY